MFILTLRQYPVMYIQLLVASLSLLSEILSPSGESNLIIFMITEVLISRFCGSARGGEEIVLMRNVLLCSWWQRFGVNRRR